MFQITHNHKPLLDELLIDLKRYIYSYQNKAVEVVHADVYWEEKDPGYKTNPLFSQKRGGMQYMIVYRPEKEKPVKYTISGGMPTHADSAREMYNFCQGWLSHHTTLKSVLRKKCGISFKEYAKLNSKEKP